MILPFNTCRAVFSCLQGLGVVTPMTMTAVSSERGKTQGNQASSLKDFEVMTVIGRGGLAKVPSYMYCM